MLRAVRTSVVAIAVTAAVATAQDPAVTGACAKPDSVAFRGNARVGDAALRGDLAITSGTALNYRTLQRAIKNLYATTQFEDVQVHCEIADGRAVLAFVLTE